MQMRTWKQLAMLASTIGIVTDAVAADLPLRGSFAPVVAAAPDWSGFYVGAHGGYLRSDADVTLADVGGAVLPIDVANGTLPNAATLTQKSGLGGAQAGYNAQFGAFVAGVESDVSFGGGKARADITAPDRLLFPGAATNTHFRSNLDWLATFRARVGVAMDRVLIYGTGGLAVGSRESFLAIDIPFVGYAPKPWTQKETTWGWAAGAGLEYALSEHVSLKAEYLHFALNKGSVTATDPATFPGQFLTYKFNRSGDIVRGGVNLRF
jgi:outer membrane immunogenic protein